MCITPLGLPGPCVYPPWDAQIDVYALVGVPRAFGFKAFQMTASFLTATMQRDMVAKSGSSSFPDGPALGYWTLIKLLVRLRSLDCTRTSDELHRFFNGTFSCRVRLLPSRKVKCLLRFFAIECRLCKSHPSSPYRDFLWSADRIRLSRLARRENSRVQPR